MARKVTLIVDELFEKLISTPEELKWHVKVLLQACHEAQCKQSAQIFGNNRRSPSGFIKMQIKDSKQPEVDYQIKSFTPREI